MAYAIIIYLNVIVPQLLDNSGLLRYLWDNSGGGANSDISVYTCYHPQITKLGIYSRVDMNIPHPFSLKCHTLSDTCSSDL